MPTTDEPHEMDDRFPTGEWRGFYVQPDSRQRHTMELLLEFAQEEISGLGDDSVGEFTIKGTYDTRTGQCWWNKQYVGQHRVFYEGRANGRGIIGQWRIPGQPASWSGPFFIWPRALGDLESEFERAFLEYELSVPAPASPAELVEARANSHLITAGDSRHSLQRVWAIRLQRDGAGSKAQDCPPWSVHQARPTTAPGQDLTGSGSTAHDSLAEITLWTRP